MRVERPAASTTAATAGCARFPALRKPELLDHLGDDRDRDLGGRPGADREADRPADPRELLVREALLAQPVEALRVRLAAAERADVERVGAQRDRERGV